MLHWVGNLALQNSSIEFQHRFTNHFYNQGFFNNWKRNIYQKVNVLNRFERKREKKERKRFLLLLDHSKFVQAWYEKYWLEKKVFSSLLVRLFVAVMLEMYFPPSQLRLTSLDVDQGGEDRTVHVGRLASHQTVVEVTPPPLGGERMELEGPVGQAGDDTRVGGERASLLAEPGDRRGRLARHPAVQDPPGLVWESEGGGWRQVKGRPIALSMQDRSWNWLDEAKAPRGCAVLVGDWDVLLAT